MGEPDNTTTVVDGEPEPQDLVPLGGGFGMLNFTTFKDKVNDLPGFEGFSPRMTLIGKLRNAEHSRNTSCLLMIIVRNNEIKFIGYSSRAKYWLSKVLFIVSPEYK